MLQFLLLAAAISFSLLFLVYVITGKGVAPFPTPWCSSYRKGSLRVTLDYGRQLYLLIILLFWEFFTPALVDGF